jgi:hypothetical protein
MDSEVLEVEVTDIKMPMPLMLGNGALLPMAMSTRVVDLVMLM